MSPEIRMARKRAESLDLDLPRPTEAVQAVPFSYGILVGITLFAAALRLYKLGAWSFWGDEMFTIRDAQIAVSTPGLHALSFTLTGVALRIFGISEWSARLVSALIGIGTIPVLYVLVRRIFGSRVALGAALLLAISPWHLYWSQNARFYTALLLFYTVALFLFFLAFERDRPLLLGLSLLFAGLALLERLTALLFMPVVVTYLALLYLVPGLGWLGIPRPSGLRPRNLALLFVPTFLGGLYMAVPQIMAWPQWLEAFGRINNNPFWIVAGVAYYVRVPILVMGLAGLAYLLLQERPHLQRAGLLLGASALVPLALIAALSLVHYTANRYVFISLTSWVVLASVAVVALFEQVRGRWSSRAVASSLLVLGLLAVLVLEPLSENLLYYRYQNGNRDDWRGAFAYVQARMQPGDRVISGHSLLGDYYLDQETIDIYGLTLSDLEALDSRTWLVADMNVPERRPGMYRWIVENAQLMGIFDVHVRARNFMLRVYLFEPGEPVRPVYVR